MLNLYLEEKLIMQTMHDRLHDAEQGQLPTAREARALFDRALRRAEITEMVARLLKRPRSLAQWRDLESSGARMLNRCYRGRKQVPLSAIVGSAGRSSDFDAGYYPKVRYIRPRWEGVATAMLAGEELPPVQLYKVGEVYFVLDGNNRVSVAKLLGMGEIEAEVTELLVTHNPASVSHPFSVRSIW